MLLLLWLSPVVAEDCKVEDETDVWYLGWLDTAQEEAKTTEVNIEDGEATESQKEERKQYLDEAALNPAAGELLGMTKN
mgnify:CR=1 FL=1